MLNNVMRKGSAGMLAAAVLIGGTSATTLAMIVPENAHAQTATQNAPLNPVGYTLQQLQDSGWTSEDINYDDLDFTHKASISNILVNGEAPVADDFGTNSQYLIHGNTNNTITFTLTNEGTSPYTVNITSDEDRWVNEVSDFGTIDPNTVIGDNLYLLHPQDDNISYTVTSGQGTVIPVGSSTTVTISMTGTYPADGTASNVFTLVTTDYNESGATAVSEKQFSIYQENIIPDLMNFNSNVVLTSPNSEVSEYPAQLQEDYEIAFYNTPVTLNLTQNDIGSHSGDSDPAPLEVYDMGFVVKKNISDNQSQEDYEYYAINEKTLVMDEGTFVINEDHTVTFTPAKDYVGEVPQVYYWVAENESQVPSNQSLATVGYPEYTGSMIDAYYLGERFSTLDIEVLPPTPTARPDTVRTKPDTPVTFSVLRNDYNLSYVSSFDFLDANGDVVESIDTPEGTFTRGEKMGEVTFTPAEGYLGTTSEYNYRITDNNGQFSESTFTVTVTDTIAPEPVATDDTFTHDYKDGMSTTVNIINNDENVDKVTLTDSDGNDIDSLSVTINGQNAGTATLNSDNELVITWNSDKPVGQIDNITYKVTNVDGVSTTAVVTGSVTETIDATPILPIPVSSDDSFTHDHKDGNTTTVDILSNDGEFTGELFLVDKNGNKVDNIDVTINGKKVGTASLNDTNMLVITWTDQGTLGEIDTIEYKITNSSGTSSQSSVTGTVSFTVVDPDPTEPPVDPVDPTEPPVVEDDPSDPITKPAPDNSGKKPTKDNTKKPKKNSSDKGNSSNGKGNSANNGNKGNSSHKSSSNDDSVLVRTGETIEQNKDKIIIGSIVSALGVLLGITLFVRTKKKS